MVGSFLATRLVEDFHHSGYALGSACLVAVYRMLLPKQPMPGLVCVQWHRVHEGWCGRLELFCIYYSLSPFQGVTCLGNFWWISNEHSLEGPSR